MGIFILSTFAVLGSIMTYILAIKVPIVGKIFGVELNKEKKSSDNKNKEFEMSK